MRRDCLRLLLLTGILVATVGAESALAQAGGRGTTDDTAALKALNEQVAKLYQQGKYEEAVPPARKALELGEKTIGADHPETATSLNNLAMLYKTVGDYAKAEPLYLRALKIHEKSLGPEHPNTAVSLANLAALYKAMGDYPKAEPLYQRALRIAEKTLGPEHPYTAQSLNNLADLYYTTRGYAKAEPLFQRALRIREKALGPEHPDTTVSLNNLAWLYNKMGDYAKAEPLYQRALNIREKVLGPEHPDTALSLNKLADLYCTMGEYTKAEPLYHRVLKIREKALGPEHPDTAQSLNNLAMVYKDMGDYAKAEPLLERALKIKEKTLGPEHPSTATGLNNLASLYTSMGDYAKAEPLYQRALKIQEKALGSEHADTAGSINNLALLYWTMGDYAKAEQLYQRALKIWEKVLGPDHPTTAVGLNNLAELYKNRVDYARAEPLIERALKIHEKSLGPEHPDTAESLNSLATLYHIMDDYAKAEPLYQRVLRIREKVGPEHPNTALSLNNLALLYESLGDYAKAEPLYQRALRIWEKALGPEHPTTALSLNNLALLSLDLRRRPEALELATRAEKAGLKTLSNILSFTSEQQRMAYQAQQNPYTLFATLGSAPDIARVVLQQKGVVLDSLLEDRLAAEASANPEDRAAIDEIRSAKQRLTQLLLGAPKDLRPEAAQQRDEEKDALAKKVEELEGSLARRVAGMGRARRALSVTVEQVQAVIPKEAVLVELIRYGHYLGKNKGEYCYGAVVLTPAGKPSWFSLGEATAIEKNVALYQKAIREKAGEKEFAALLADLYKQIWSPLEGAVPAGTRTVIISTDGQLSFLSFATLLTPRDKFLGEEFSITYVSSGRDLLLGVKPATKPGMTIYANPDFSVKGPAAAGSTIPSVALRSAEMRDLGGIYLGPLPGTAKECAALQAEAKRWGWPAEALLGAEATEARLQAVRSPRVLHLATHGFFLPEESVSQPGLAPGGRGVGGVRPLDGAGLMDDSGNPLKRQPLLKNPMHRSGIALAGAQATIDAWKKGEVPPTANDGILTAEEAGGLKLDGTWLVTLSACDTGTGEARSGEGVLGLRRGFIQAGAQNLLLTLWPIKDDETARLMVDFYAAGEKSGNAPQALADMQRDALVRIRKQQGLLAAVRLAGSFILSGQGPTTVAGTPIPSGRQETAAGEQTAAGKVTVTTDQAPVMKGKDTVFLAKKGDVFDVSGMRGEWYGVLPSRGWIHKANVRYEPSLPRGR
jgi:tetratricopeptide (TPR) repeat protein